MRIISGIARGTKLYTLEGVDTRPTLDRVKEALFSIIQNDIEDSLVLDLFSGSGALALESLSRGAKKAVLCDNSYKAIKIIRQNVEKTKFFEKVEILETNYDKAIEKLKNEKFDIIFLDPPYKTDFLIKSIEKIFEGGLLQQDGMIIAETDDEIVINQIKEKDLNVVDIRNYGRVKLIFIRWKE